MQLFTTKASLSLTSLNLLRISRNFQLSSAPNPIFDFYLSDILQMMIKIFPRTSFIYNFISFHILPASFLCKFTKGNNGWISSSTTKEILPSTKLNKWRSSEQIFTRAGICVGVGWGGFLFGLEKIFRPCIIDL